MAGGIGCRAMGLLCLLGTSLAMNERPIIGIVSESVYRSAKSYIAASYVKYLESAGARVVPILNNSTEAEVQHLFRSINGVLFPGGGVSLTHSQYKEVGVMLYKLATEANDRGDYFPLWGTCLGFQLLSVIQADNDSILSHVDAENYPIPLTLTQDAQKSRLFSLFTPEAMQWIGSENITMNNHQWSVTTETFSSTPRLNEFFTVLSTNKDRKGVEFVSTMEAKKYPLYAVQWHPEKNNFEWTTKEDIPHSGHAVAISQLTADFLVQEARKSTHKFASEEEEDHSLIYNYTPTFTGGNSSFEQKYYF